MKVVLCPDPIVFPYDKTKTGYSRFSGYADKLMSTILNEMNATITVKITKSAGFVDEHEKFHGAIKDVLSKTADLLMNTFLSSSIINVLCLKESERYRFQFNFDSKCWLLIIVACFTSIVILKYILKQTITSTVLEFTHILLYGQLIRVVRPKDLPKKTSIYTTCDFYNQYSHIKPIKCF